MLLSSSFTLDLVRVSVPRLCYQTLSVFNSKTSQNVFSECAGHNPLSFLTNNKCCVPSRTRKLFRLKRRDWNDSRTHTLNLSQTTDKSENYDKLSEEGGARAGITGELYLKGI